MAARFRVGAGGNWSDTGHWSATSGGASGASVPVAADDVTFDSGCSGTTTVDVAANANSVTMNNSGAALSQAAGKSLTVVGAVTLTTGGIATNGEAFSWGSFSSSNSNVRTLTLGASAGAVTANSTVWVTSTATNMTITANTATVTFTGVSAIAASTSNLNHNGLSLAFVGGCGGTPTPMQLQGAWTIRNLTVTGTAQRLDQMKFTSSMTFTGTFVVNGATAAHRIWIQTDNPGTTRTLTVAVHGAHSNVDFMDVAIAGAAGTLTGTLIGNCGGNSGITFTPSATQTWQGTAGGNWSDVTKWTSRVPLPQDDVLIASAFTAGQTVLCDVLRACRSMDWTGTTGNPTFTIGGFGATVNFFGSMTLGSVVTIGGSGNSTAIMGRGAFTLTSDVNKKISISSLFGTPFGGTYTLLKDIVLAGQFNPSNGTFDANGFNVTTTFLNQGTGGTRQIVFGSGTWTITGTGTVIDLGGSAGLTVVPGTALLDITDASSTAKVVNGAGKSFPTLRYRSTGAGNLTINGSNSYLGLDIEATTARTVTFQAGTTQNIANALTLQGAAGQLLSVASSSPGTAVTLIVTSCTGTYTHSNTSLSADVVVKTTICGSALAPFESVRASRTPKMLAVPNEEMPPTLLSATLGTVVALVRTNFASSDVHAGNLVIFSLDDGTNNNRIQSVWGVADTWQIRRSQGGGIDNTPQVGDTFGIGALRLVAMSWDAVKNYLSIAGAPFQSAAATQFPASLTHLMVGRGALGSATGDFWGGDIVWIAGFSAPLADADVAALQASFAASDPQFAQLPGSPTFLYTKATGYFVTTASGALSGRPALESLAGEQAQAFEPLELLSSATGAALEPVEAVAGVVAAAADPLEALAGMQAAAENPLEALSSSSATADEPFEVLVGPAARSVTEPLEALAGIVRTVPEPLEAVGAVAGRAVEPLETTISDAKASVLPFESRGVPQRGKASGKTVRSSAADGKTERSSSIVRVRRI